MLATSGDDARERFRRWRAKNDVVHEYITFIYEHIPEKERSQYLADEWRQVAHHVGLDVSGLAWEDVAKKVQSEVDDHHSVMRNLLSPTGLGALDSS